MLILDRENQLGAPGNKGKIVVKPRSRKRHLYSVDTMPIAGQI